ncbi:hypothetical protein D3C78_1721740 [compost metagenome]
MALAHWSIGPKAPSVRGLSCSISQKPTVDPATSTSVSVTTSRTKGVQRGRPGSRQTKRLTSSWFTMKPSPPMMISVESTRSTPGACCHETAPAPSRENPALL